MREAIVLAGGFGTRLRQVVSDVPKPMAPVGGRPFLTILLDALARKNFDRVVLSLGFMADNISRHFGNRYKELDLIYVVEHAPLGTGGAVRKAMTQCREDHVFVFNGDTYLDLEVEAAERHWQSRHNPIIIGIESPDASRYGRLFTHKGRVTGFSEKGFSGPGLINAGCYVLNHGQLDSFPVDTTFSLETDYLAQVVGAMPVDVFVTQGYFIDIGIPEDFERAQIELAGW